jgi:hypothetical protein
MDNYLEKLSMKYCPCPYYMDNVHEIWAIEKKIILSVDSRCPWPIVHETYKTQLYEVISCSIIPKNRLKYRHKKYVLINRVFGL